MHLPIPTQVQLVARLLRCERIEEIKLDQFTQPWRGYVEWCIESPAEETPAERWQEFFLEYSANSEEDMINCKRLKRALQTPDEVASALDILDDLPDQVWLWPGWIARRQLTLLAGTPGAGKSYLSLDIARRIVAGTEWPDGQDITQPGTVLYLDAEDRPTLFKTRMQPWSPAERRGLYYLRPREDDFMFNVDYLEHRERLAHWVYTTQPRLIIIDSYGSITLKGENNKEEVQLTLRFFTKMALEYDCGVLLLHHLRKRPNIQLALPGMQRMTQDMVRGSGHITAMATNLIGLQTVQTGPTFDPNGPREIQMVKSNIGKYPDPIGLAFQPWPNNSEVALLIYTVAPQPYSEPSKVESAICWLVTLLEEEGPLPPADILEQGQKDGHSRSTLYRARKAADQIVDTKGPYREGNCWALDWQIEGE